MYQITGITTDPLQKQTIFLDSGKQIDLTLYFMAQQYCWVIRELNYDNGAFVLDGFKITSGLNLLNQFRNILPFGLACVTTGNRDPQFQEDFSGGASVLYILDETEKGQYLEYISNG